MINTFLNFLVVTIFVGHLQWTFCYPQTQLTQSKNLTIQPLTPVNNNTDCNFPSEQLFALYDFYNSTNGDRWRWRRPALDPYSGVKWNFTSINPNPCSENWAGLKCSQIEVNTTCTVTILHLNTFDLHGSLPNSLNLLTTLEEFDIGINRLSNTIPESITDLIKLKILILGSNNFNSTIPSTIGNLKALQFLDLSRNSLEGTFPKSLQYLQSLTYLNISSNNIADAIPRSFSYLNSLQIMDLSTNNLYGTIPSWLSQITSLVILQLSDNKLEGSIPSTLGEFPVMERLKIANNSLIGTLPVTLSSLTTLIEFNLGDNFLHGEISEGFFQNWNNLRNLNINNNWFNGTFPFQTICNTTTQLIELTISYNNFNGTIPSELSYLHNLEILRLSNNYFSGKIPLEIGKLKHLRDFETYYNLMTGLIPYTLGNLTSIITMDLGYNFYTGTIPVTLCNIPSLTFLLLNHNHLNGSIPDCIGQNLTGLRQLLLQSNQLTGSIPININNLTFIHDLYLYGNYFIGSLPYTFGKTYIELTQIDLHDNLLSGTLPSTMCNMHQLNYMYLSQNMFHGNIPECMGDITQIFQFFVEYNYFSGTLPLSFQNFTRINSITVNSNLLTGTIASGIYSMGNRLIGFLLSNNFFTGTIPDDIAAMSRLRVLNMSNNSLSGSLPWGMSNMTSMVSLDLSSNAFTNSIPSGLLSRIPVLRTVFLEDNFFSGALANVFNTSHTTVYGDIDVSSNYFTGSLDSELFTNSPNLVTFAAVKNCITGSIPDSICSCKFARAIALDGLHAASRCQSRIFPQIPFIRTYQLTEDVQGTIPSCIYNMTLLKTLHLSGNGIKGTLPSSMIVGNFLVDLSLSHNLLRGKIPDVLQTRVISNLDLSFNQLNGRLIDNFASYPLQNTSLALQVNRLSGPIPSSLLQLLNISILQGNIFSCVHGDSSLPQHDEYSSSYICGSDNINAAMFVWIVAFGVLIISIVCWVLYLRKKVEDRMGRLFHAIVEWWSVFDDPQVLYDISSSGATAVSRRSRSPSLGVILRHSSRIDKTDITSELSTTSANQDKPKPFWIQIILLIRSTLFDTSGLNMTAKSTTHDGKVNYIFRFGLLLGRLRKVVAHVMTMVLFLLMPTYIVLNNLYSMYEYAYAWQVGLAFISGVIPSLVLFILFFAFSVRIYYLLKTWLFESYVEEILVGRIQSIRFTKNPLDGGDDGIFKRKMLHKQLVQESIESARPRFYLRQFVIFLVNCTIVLTVNMAYVSATTLQLNKRLLLFIVLVVSLFKIAWGNIVVTLFRGFLLRTFEQTNDEEKENICSDPEEDVGSQKDVQQAILEHFTSLSLRFLVYLSIFNNVIAPSVAAMLVSPNCFYFMLVESPPVTVSYEFLHCVQFFSNTVTNSCVKYGFASHSTSYSPPYTYTYQCSSSLATSFTDIFIYRYVFTGLFLPFVVLIIKYLQGYFYRKWQNQCQQQSSSDRDNNGLCKSLFLILSSMLPMMFRLVNSSSHTINFVDGQQHDNTMSVSNPIFRSVNHNTISKSLTASNRKRSSTKASVSEHWYGPERISEGSESIAQTGGSVTTAALDANFVLLPKDKKSRKVLFNKDIFTVGFVGDLAVLMTFGVIFPPLAVVIFFNILVNTFLTQLLMGRFINIAKELVRQSSTIAVYLLPLVDFLNDECRDIGRLIFDSIPTIAVLATFFWSFALFDTLADSTGTKRAIWILLLVAFMPFGIIGLEKIYFSWGKLYAWILLKVFGVSNVVKKNGGRTISTDSSFRASEWRDGNSERGTSVVLRPSTMIRVSNILQSNGPTDGVWKDTEVPMEDTNGNGGIEMRFSTYQKDSHSE